MNYVFPTFILTYMPVGLVGLMIAAIVSAAMSASSGEMNALATATVIDFYRRHVNPHAPRRARRVRVADGDGVLGALRVRRRGRSRRIAGR